MHVSIDQKLPIMVSGNEILNVPQSLGKSYNTMCHGSKFELKQFSKYSINVIPKNAGKSAIIIEISPLIRAKCSQKAELTELTSFLIIIFMIAWKKAQEKAEELEQYWCLMMILIFYRIWLTIFWEIARMKTI